MVWTLLALCLVLMPPPVVPRRVVRIRALTQTVRTGARWVCMSSGAVAAAIAGMVMVPFRGHSSWPAAERAWRRFLPATCRGQRSVERS